MIKKKKTKAYPSLTVVALLCALIIVPRGLLTMIIVMITMMLILRRLVIRLAHAITGCPWSTHTTRTGAVVTVSRLVFAAPITCKQIYACTLNTRESPHRLFAINNNITQKLSFVKKDGSLERLVLVERHNWISKTKKRKEIFASRVS